MGAILATIFTLVVVAISSIAVVNPNLNLSNLSKAASLSCLDPCTNNSDCGAGNYCYKPATGCPVCKKTIKPTATPTPKKPTATPSPTTSPQTLLIQKKACELEGGTWKNNKCIDSHEITTTPSPIKTPTPNPSPQCIKSGDTFSSSIPCCSSLVKVVTPYGTICGIKGTECTAGAKKCQVGANNTFFEYKCDASGYYQQDKRCDFGCNGNTCKTNGCTPNQKICDGDVLKTCSSDGSAWGGESCPNGCDSTNKICKPTPTPYCSNHQLIDCAGGCKPTTTGGTCITLTPFCSSGNLTSCNTLCTPSLGGGSCPASTTTCDGKPNGTSECTVNHDSLNYCNNGNWTNIKCPSGYFCPTGGTSCKVSCIPEKKLIYGCGHGISTYGEFTVVYRETKQDCTSTEYPEVSDTCVKNGELLTESLGKSCRGNEDCNGGYCYNDYSESGMIDVMNEGDTCHAQSATSYRRQNLEAQNEAGLEVAPYFAAIPLAYFAGPQILNIAEGNLSSIPAATSIYTTNLFSKLPTWTGTALEAAGTIPAVYLTTKCNLSYCSPEEQTAAQETAFYTALGIQQTIEDKLASLYLNSPTKITDYSTFGKTELSQYRGSEKIALETLKERTVQDLEFLSKYFDTAIMRGSPNEVSQYWKINNFSSGNKVNNPAGWFDAQTNSIVIDRNYDLWAGAHEGKHALRQITGETNNLWFNYTANIDLPIESKVIINSTLEEVGTISYQLQLLNSIPNIPKSYINGAEEYLKYNTQLYMNELMKPNTPEVAAYLESLKITDPEMYLKYSIPTK